MLSCKWALFVMFSVPLLCIAPPVVALLLFSVVFVMFIVPSSLYIAPPYQFALLLFMLVLFVMVIVPW